MNMTSATGRHGSSGITCWGALVLTGFAFVGCSPPFEPADIVLVGGPVVTLAEAGVVGGIAVTGSRIVAVGAETEIRRYIGEDTRVIDLAGRSVIPGLADNHFHSSGGGPGVDLSTARSIRDVLDAISARAASTPSGEVIVTNSDWHEGQLAEQRLVYRDELDEAAPNHAVVVVRGGHEYILNSAGLRRWGITESTPNVPGGRIGRYADGRLNGELVDRAKDPVELPSSPSASPEAVRTALMAEYATLNRRGLTSVRHPGGSVEQFEVLQSLREAGRLTLRIDFLFRAPRAGSPDAMRSAMSAWPAPDAGDAWLRIGGIKHGVDGGFEGGLMRDPYEEPWGEGGTFYGLQTVPREAFIESVQELNRAGWRVATHAVGDAAIDLVLDAYEVVDAETPLDGRRWVIEHGFIPREDHFARMRAMGLSVTAQDHLYLAAPSLVEYWGRERAAWTTPLRAYIDAGIPVSLGTDSPVVPYDPWWVLHHFTTRGTISAGIVGADQRVSREEALRAATEGYAYLTFSENERGTLAAGMLADLVVTAENYLECPDPCLETMQVDFTIVDGRIVWER
ncbi:MAG: amidohydrolase [Gemmatimonadetes bacterium]|nr:amidohydrolase [Gemmatimonadota bacterium]MDA1102152.1 amidohydrolase [Gemmatimonadota bacterium]